VPTILRIGPYHLFFYAGDRNEPQHINFDWEDIDEDISVEGLLAGRPSGESRNSFKKWLAKRSKGAS
jgi:hypothetical protein